MGLPFAAPPSCRFAARWDLTQAQPWIASAGEAPAFPGPRWGSLPAPSAALRDHNGIRTSSLTSAHPTTTLLSGDSMSQLVVRKLEPAVVEALRRRAAAHGRSAEAEHREILRTALLIDSKAEAFKEWLLSMPNVGEDADFERPTDPPRDVDL